jgi:enterochelin esterase family protein
VNNTDLYEKYVLKDVMPLVESKYRVKPGRENRAIAGLSMGGGQTIAIGFRHLDLFSVDRRIQRGDSGRFREGVRADDCEPQGGQCETEEVFWFACGKQDSLFERSQKFSDLLDAHQIKHTFQASEGAHVYKVWRHT